MAIEHEPGCDRQHTVRQRCNQNALFAEQGEVPAEMADQRPSPGAISAVSERPPPAPEAPPALEAVEEIVAIREEVMLPAPPQPAPPQPPDREETEASAGYAPLIAAALAFAVLTILLVTLLRKRPEPDS